MELKDFFGGVIKIKFNFFNCEKCLPIVLFENINLFEYFDIINIYEWKKMEKTFIIYLFGWINNTFPIVLFQIYYTYSSVLTIFLGANNKR